MNQELTNCPYCNATIKSGLLSSTTLAMPEITYIINMYHEPKAGRHCSKCVDKLARIYVPRFKKEKIDLFNSIRKSIGEIPVITINNPIGWEYDVISTVTAQTTTGTGVISEVTSSFTDLFGAQSGRYNNKLKEGENLCFAQLRKQAIDLGANAIIATDIDYAEVGGLKGMLMVCMAGTAINLKNLNVLGEERATKIEKTKENVKELNRLEKIEIKDIYNHYKVED